MIHGYFYSHCITLGFVQSEKEISICVVSLVWLFEYMRLWYYWNILQIYSTRCSHSIYILWLLFQSFYLCLFRGNPKCILLIEKITWIDWWLIFGPVPIHNKTRSFMNNLYYWLDPLSLIIYSLLLLYLSFLWHLILVCCTCRIVLGFYMYLTN